LLPLEMSGVPIRNLEWVDARLFDGAVSGAGANADVVAA
jgi:hypothetical protein